MKASWIDKSRGGQVSPHDPLPVPNTQLLSGSELSPSQSPLASLALSVGTFRGRLCDRGRGHQDKTLKGKGSCLYKAMHADVGEQAAVSSKSSHRAP